MSRRPIERVPIAEQCARCGRRRLAGEVLCRAHLHLKQQQEDVAREQLHPLVHQDVGRADKAGHSQGAPAVHGGPTSQSAPVPTPVVGSLPASPESGSVMDSRQQPTTQDVGDEPGDSVSPAENVPGFLPTHPLNREEQRQAQEAASFGSSVLVPVLDKTCPHRGDGVWCDWCEMAADYDDGGSE